MAEKNKSKKTGSRSFGAFKGVFIPTFLSIIGVILFLRLGRIVGSIGLVGTLLIIGLAVSVTFCTGLSLSSITTNIKIGAGGAYSIISKTMGLEIGGSTGLPLYLAQTLSVTLYIFGFGEAWKFLFPQHPTMWVLYGAFIFLFILTFVNLKYAIHAQLAVFFVVLLALMSIFLGGSIWNGAVALPSLTGFAKGNFWVPFALFFPAVTGLMAGVGLSGELKDPKRQIPKGVLWSLGITTVIYLFVTFWLWYSASPAELISNNLILAKLAAFPRIVLLGILMATFSSALTTFVAAPRLLNALGRNSILPSSNFFAKRSERGEPRNAVLFSALIIFIALTVGSLDIIAPVLTMFFLITYAMINFAVFIEQGLGLISFRPTLKISKFVPLYGLIGSIIFMFYINLFAGLIAVTFMIMIYLYLVKKKLKPKGGGVRSGLFYAISEWAAKKVRKFPESRKDIWRPDIMLPIEKSGNLMGSYLLLKSMLHPAGDLSILNIELKEDKKKNKEISGIIEKLEGEGIFTSYTEVNTDDYTDGVSISLQAVKGQVFYPNILFIPKSPKEFEKKSSKRILETASEGSVGVAFLDKDEKAGLGSEEDIHIWVPSNVLEKDFYDKRFFDLALLLGYILQRNWIGKIRLWMPVENEKKRGKARGYLRRLIYEARLPASTKMKTPVASFKEGLEKASKGDIHLIPIKDSKELNEKLKVTEKFKRTFMYVMDSGEEDILA